MMTRFAIRMPPEVQSVQIGEHQLVFIDDFLEDPQALIEAACAAAFEPCPGADEGKGYPGLRAPAPMAYADALAELAEPLIRQNFQMPDELAMRRSVDSFSLTTVVPERLGPLQCTPHFDASTPHHMAVLLFLCDERHGGTGFYRHRATGLQRITSESREQYLDRYHAEVNERRPRQRYFDAGDERFEFLGLMPARFNRLVVYPGSLLHSACVNPRISLSADPRQGRLTVNSFYDF